MTGQATDDWTRRLTEIRQLMAERRAIYNQVTELTNRIKQQSH